VAPVSVPAYEPDPTTEPDVVDHQIIGARLRPQPAQAVLTKTITTGLDVGLSQELA
jgi:hypothetical protein